ncbi:MAG: hypothetical protein GY714_19950 [Desulfobacterales bacterium]|nr:hypothetical protein [Desulfobacterales bacterium]
MTNKKDKLLPFTEKVIDFCTKQNYEGVGATNEKEFSQVAFRLYGCFTLQGLTLEQITEITNCILCARARAETEEYKKYEFCKAVKCHELQDDKCLFDSTPKYCVNGYKAFVYKWLKENNYKIIK